MNDATTDIAPISVDDIRRKAMHIKDMAEVEVHTLVDDRRSQLIAIGVVAFAVGLSLAYYLGRRAASER